MFITRGVIARVIVLCINVLINIQREEKLWEKFCACDSSLYACERVKGPE